eukprot:1139265-Pelagomonas_calceolata.AAC.5
MDPCSCVPKCNNLQVPGVLRKRFLVGAGLRINIAEGLFTICLPQTGSDIKAALISAINAHTHIHVACICPWTAQYLTAAHNCKGWSRQ